MSIRDAGAQKCRSAVKKICISAFLHLCILAPAHASPIVADVSTYHIAIDTGFTGIRLFIFGARNESGDVIVVVRGPERDFVIRKKEPVGGVWVNRDRLELAHVPEFYALASAHPLDVLQAAPLLSGLGIGTLPLLPVPLDGHGQKLFPEFSTAFLKNQTEEHLYNAALPLGFMGETLFKTTIPFPDNIPKGNYTAEIYLISDGELAGMQAMPIRVEKTGFDAVIAYLAYRHSLLYGLLAVALAMSAGWAAGKIFERS